MSYGEKAELQGLAEYIEAGDELLPIPEADNTADDDTRDEYAFAIYERDRFLIFADAIEGAVKACGEVFIERLQKAVSELEDNRERAIVKGEN